MDNCWNIQADTQGTTPEAGLSIQGSGKVQWRVLNKSTTNKWRFCDFKVYVKRKKERKDAFSISCFSGFIVYLTEHRCSDKTRHLTSENKDNLMIKNKNNSHSPTLHVSLFSRFAVSGADDWWWFRSLRWPHQEKARISNTHTCPYLTLILSSLVTVGKLQVLLITLMAVLLRYLVMAVN